MPIMVPRPLKVVYGTARLTWRFAQRALGLRSVTCRVRGIPIRLGISSEMEQFRAETYESKEPETLDWLDGHIDERAVFFDVGANIGLYSLYAAKICPAATIFAFEPESQNYARLCHNIVLNAITNVVPCCFPLSDREDFDYFYVGDFQAGAALHSLGRPSELLVGGKPVRLKQGNLSTTLDALVARYGLPQPTVLKIDVDGIEERILDGAKAVLQSEKLQSLLVELNFHHGVTRNALEEKIAGLGYRVVLKSDRVWQQGGVKSQNCIFSRS